MAKQNPPAAGKGSWVPYVLVGAGIGILMVLVARYSSRQAPSQGQDTNASQPASAPSAMIAERGKNAKGKQLPPDFTLADLATGTPIQLSKLEGKVVLMDFWATWCGPCRMEIPHFVELYDKYKGKGFVLLGVSVDQQGPEVVKNFMTQWKVNYPMIHDQVSEIGMAYGGIRSIPTTLLIGKDGSVRQTFVGYRQKEEFEAAIKKALAEI